MSEKCKYCDYVSKCSRFCEYNSIMCLMHRSFPKIVDKTYEELEKENQDLKKQLEESIKSYTEENALRHKMSLDLNTIKTKQKEFIEYLESEINLFAKYMKNIERSDRPHGDYPITYWSSKYKLNEVAEILSKYKEIIGVKDEKINVL